MKKTLTTLLTALFITATAGASHAHFGMVIPSDSMIMMDDPRTISIAVSFSHPFESIGMPMERPSAFRVYSNGNFQDIQGTLKQITVMGEKSWTADYRVSRPGVYTFLMEPRPYWEPAEDCFIIHYTKTVAAAFGNEDGWDEPLGVKTEIVPLTRPFGNYSGNIFQGTVMLDGKPAPHAEVEVEYYNRDRKASAPTDYMITQVIKADSNGVFAFAVPRAGWWGFAALNTSDEKIKFEGEEKDVEIGAVLWVEFLDWQE